MVVRFLLWKVKYEGMKPPEPSWLSIATLVGLCCAGLWVRPDAGPEEMRLAYIGPGAGFAFLGSFLSLLSGFVLECGFASALAVPHGLAHIEEAAGFPKGAGKADDLSRTGRARPSPDGEVPGRRQTSEPRAAAGPGKLSPAADDLSVAVSGRLVHLRHWRQSGTPRIFSISSTAA